MRTMPPRKKTTIPDDSLAGPVKHSEETFTFRATHFYAVLVVMAWAIGVLIGYLAWGSTPIAPAVVAQVAGPPAAPAPTPEKVQYSIPADGFPAIGPADAPITIVEFSDYQCPYCTRWHEQTYESLLQAYPGKIRFVYRNYPLAFHQNAMLSAQAALCAGDQDQYWPYHDKLFDEKALINNAEGTTLEPSSYVTFATDLGLDATAFEACLTSGKYKEAVQADMTFADGLPTENGEPAVGGTPTFFINGTRLVGAYPLASFKEIIDAQLAAMP
jgi:protein-disulfide isomerase